MVESAFGIEEFRRIMLETAGKMEEGFMFSFTLPKSLSIIDEYSGLLVSRGIAAEFKRNGFDITYPAHAYRTGEDWCIEAVEGKFRVVSTALCKFEVYYIGKPPKMNIKDIKGIFLSEIIKADPTIVFISRNKLKFTVDSCSELLADVGDSKAEIRRHRRMKNYKRRVDKWWKEAKKSVKAE